MHKLNGAILALLLIGTALAAMPTATATCNIDENHCVVDFLTGNEDCMYNPAPGVPPGHTVRKICWA